MHDAARYKDKVLERSACQCFWMNNRINSDTRVGKTLCVADGGVDEVALLLRTKLA